MTEEDLVTALDGLLESGLVAVDVEEAFDEEACVPRFRVTARGRLWTQDVPAVLHCENAVSDEQRA
jgi:hypothetical protein